MAMKAAQLSKIFLMLILFLIGFVFITHGLTAASLAPEEIVVLVNTNSPDSIRIGELYIKLRAVPHPHLIDVSTATDEWVSRKEYEEHIEKPVRKAISEFYNQGERIRCIVSTYGIPLRITTESPLIVPGEKIEEYNKKIGEKSSKLSELKKKRKEKKELGKDLNRNIQKLKSEIENLQLELGQLSGADTLAAVDSELALLLVPDYPLAGWQPNPAFLMNRGRRYNYLAQVLMVSRLDAQTSALAEGLIRTAIEVEKTGLSGKIYLDARGMTNKNAYGLYDEDIRRAARILERGSMQVVLDNRPGLFRPGEAPSAALYCGWYSHRYYVDAFEWSKGAVGYHMASSEAVSLHNPQAKFWVKSMIEKGVIASIGPVAEPYLNAFPLPSLFFPLLMSGKYTLVEVFALTNPYLSWRMILVGDPLYNPFKNKPAFDLENPPPPPE
jgi:uncharacterized protein (TIGR03790 family)